MYLIEGERSGFTYIPVSLDWVVVTLMTVGYGDIVPRTVPGRLLPAIAMFSGYGVIACPLVLNTQTEEEALKPNCECVRCFRTFHQDDANFCRHCGTALRMPETKRCAAAPQGTGEGTERHAQVVGELECERHVQLGDQQRGREHGSRERCDSQADHPRARDPDRC